MGLGSGSRGSYLAQGARRGVGGPHPSPTLLLPSYSLSQVGPEGCGHWAGLLLSYSGSYSLSQVGPGSRGPLTLLGSRRGPESPAQVHTPLLLSYSPPSRRGVWTWAGLSGPTWLRE